MNMIDAQVLLDAANWIEDVGTHNQPEQKRLAKALRKIAASNTPSTLDTVVLANRRDDDIGRIGQDVTAALARAISAAWNAGFDAAKK